MKIKFEGILTDEEAITQIINIFELFQEKYDIQDFQNLEMTMELLNGSGEAMEIVDSNSLDVVEVFEVHKEEDEEVQPTIRSRQSNSPLSLVVDNTRQKNTK